MPAHLIIILIGIIIVLPMLVIGAGMTTHN